MTPPGLAWLPSFSNSTGMAVDQTILTDVESTVNPLVYNIRVRWPHGVSMKIALMIFNLFQKWAGKNKTTVQGDVRFDERQAVRSLPSVVKGFEVKVHLRERLGLPRNEQPE